MGRKGSDLVLFFQEGLKDNKYVNLKHSTAARNAFSLNLPRKGWKLKAEHQHLFKDWYARKGRLYKYFEDYTQAKGSMEAALRKSMFFEHVKPLEKSERDKFIYRILDDLEIKEKKKGVKDNTKDFTIASIESGYGSLSDSPGDCIEDSDSECNVVEPTYIEGDCVLNQIETHDQASAESMPGMSCADEDLDYIDELIQQDSDFYPEHITKGSIENNSSGGFENMPVGFDNFKELPDLNQDIEMIPNNGAEKMIKLKVYELMKTIDLGGVVQLVFESKLKKISSLEHHDSNDPLLIIDVDTFKMMLRSNYTETKYLDDYLLVFLKLY